MGRSCGECGAPAAASVPTVVFNPRIRLPGTPTISGTRLSAAVVATVVMLYGVEEFNRGWNRPPAEVVVACWWAGLFSPERKLKAHFRKWAEEVGQHLWYGCINVPPYPEPHA